MVDTPGVKIVVAPDGTLKVEGIGFQGTACEAHLEAALQALNITPDEEELKTEYYDISQDQELHQGT